MIKNFIKNYIRFKWEAVSNGVEKLRIKTSANKLGSNKNMIVEFVAYRALKDLFSPNVGSSPNKNYEFHIDSFIDEEQRLRSNSIIVINGGFFDSPKIDNDGLPGYNYKQPIGYIKPKNSFLNFSEDSQYYCHNVDKEYKKYYGLIYTNDDADFRILPYSRIPLPIEDFLSKQSTYVSGAPILIQNNLIVFDEVVMQNPIFKWNHKSKKNAPGFLHHADQPNPRSIFGLNNKYNFFVTVKGRSGNTIGLNLAECAILMSALGCTDAINLDGGDSSQVRYANRNKKNSSFGGNREVPDVLFLTRKCEYSDDFINLKRNMVNCLNGYINNTFLNIFSNHYHNKRAKEVKNAILKSNTVLQIHAILLNQLSLFNSNIEFEYNYDDLEVLKDRYALKLKNSKNVTRHNSGYVKALYLAYKEAQKIYPNSFSGYILALVLV